MWSSDSDPELAAATATENDSSSTTASPPPSPPPPAALHSSRHRHRRQRKKKNSSPAAEASPEAEDVWRGAQWEAAWPGRLRPKKPVVLAEAEDKVGRSRSLTDDDLEELKGCADLGFGFSYHEIPELRGTLPALELCYSMTQRLRDEEAQQPEAAADGDATPAVTNWKISSPGDSPDEVKARLKYWAQAVACTVRLCS
ncbi:hypothetical protein PR202_gb00204 [Eleusine coracana subsp. coracana]|uniref:Uncharacterized protein n=1 Tax=Eleusine coracana subsp. coracana TaxID=191504 RepID=A0AAV5DS09_ELECO|nr:hypothetical protein QOZ80_5BG0433020 [Eleusine coracana subsp. coracana]GJN13494.1 hypothetical protein PR202_gb00204 [Eleusine coracana subsp. coracana]